MGERLLAQPPRVPFGGSADNPWIAAVSVVGMTNNLIILICKINSI